MKRMFQALALFGCAWSQDTNAVLEGQVTDPSGSVIVGATVQAVNTRTGYTQTQTTTAAGRYHLTLPIGEYTLNVSSSNFARHVRSAIELNVSQTARVDVTLPIATGKDTVTVATEAPLVDP